MPNPSYPYTLPSRSKSLPTVQNLSKSMAAQTHGQTAKRKHGHTTRNIRKPGDVANLNFCTFTQKRNGLISWSFEIPAYAYCHPLCAIEMRDRT